MTLPIHKEWNKDARKMFVGRTIVSAEYMTTEHANRIGWGDIKCGSLILTLDNGQKFFSSTDDEGNGPGALFVELNGIRVSTFPVCPVRGDEVDDKANARMALAFSIIEEMKAENK